MAITIEEVRALNDPQKVYKWRVILPNIGLSGLKNRIGQFAGQIPGINGTPLDNTINSQTEALTNGAKNKADQAAQTFNPSLQVEEVLGLPFFSVDRDPFYEAGRNTHFPSLEDLPTFTIVFYQDASNRIPSYINGWKRKIVNQDGTKNLPSNYKFPITVHLLNGLNQVTYEIQLLGCFPTQTSGYNLTNESENLKLTQEFSVDRVEYGPISDLRGNFKQNQQDKLLRKSRQILNDDANFSFLERPRKTFDF